MRRNFFGLFVSPVIVGLVLVSPTMVFASAVAVQQAGSASGSDSSQGQEGRSRGFGGFPGGGRSVLGTVTEAAADHYTIKTDSGETYIVHFSANTRIMKQGQGRRQRGAADGGGQADSGERAAPQPLKPTDIKVGDIITAGGEMDSAAKSIGAVFIAQVDPERAKQMREMQANYGKTWLAGRITAIDGTTITIEGIVDHAPHSIVVDENTSFHQRRDAITLADIKPGEQLRAEGMPKGSAFLATTVTAMEPQDRDRPRSEGPSAGTNQSPTAKPNPQ